MLLQTNERPPLSLSGGILTIITNRLTDAFLLISITAILDNGD